VSVDPILYTEIKFSQVTQYEVGGVSLVIGHLALSDEGRLDLVVYAAALNEFDLRHRARAFGATRARAVAELFNKMH
jgi:hypothetical protein